MKYLVLVLCVFVLYSQTVKADEEEIDDEKKDESVTVLDKKQTKRGIHHLGHHGLPGFGVPSFQGLAYSLPPTYAHRYGYSRPWPAAVPTVYRPAPPPLTLFPGSASVQSYSVNYPRYPFVQRKPIFNVPFALPRPVLAPVPASLTPIANVAPTYNFAPHSTPFFVPQRPVVNYAPTPLPQVPAPFFISQRPIIPVAVPFKTFQRPNVIPASRPTHFAPAPVYPTGFPVAAAPQAPLPYNPGFGSFQPQFVPIPLPSNQPPLTTLATPTHQHPQQFAFTLGTSSHGITAGWRPMPNLHVRPLHPTPPTVNIQPNNRPSVGLLPPYSFSSNFANSPNNVGALEHRPHDQTQIYISSTPSPNSLIEENQFNNHQQSSNQLYSSQEQENDYERQLLFHHQQHQEQFEQQQQQQHQQQHEQHQQQQQEQQNGAFNGQGYDEASNQGRYAGPSSYDVEINGHRGY